LALWDFFLKILGRSCNFGFQPNVFRTEKRNSKTTMHPDEAPEAYHNAHQQVIDACLRGDRKAQYTLYRQYAKAMYNVCVRICGHTAEAEDVLQEAFLLAFGKIGTYRSEAAFGAWLKRIVVNTAINQVRKQKTAVLPIDEAGEVAEDTTDEPAMQQLRLEQVRKAIDHLPDGFRIVFSLYLLEGYDHNEIAEILGISVSTSKSQYKRAKDRVLQWLAQEGVH
jgi:RNA polymerase sigma-70 factor (ECF subfamily)